MERFKQGGAWEHRGKQEREGMKPLKIHANPHGILPSHNIIIIITIIITLIRVVIVIKQPPVYKGPMK